MRSFAILRTNTGLTTNIKIMVDSKYGMHLESIDSVPELTSTKLKKVSFNKDNYYDELIPHFFKNLPIDISFSIKYDNDNDNMFNDFQKQYDDIYQMGARNIIDNKNYIEEFECFAPLYISSIDIPKSFIVFRVDGPGLTKLDRTNFKNEIINKLKCVKVFDLTKSSTLGEWIDKNFISNKIFPSTPFEIDFRRLEFSKWNGIDYQTGGYTYKSFFLDQTLEKENAIFDLEKFVFDGYKNNKVVFPNIINFSFLFDDTPATPKSLRKWSINRYFGFYVDEMELYDSVTPNLLPKIKSDTIVQTGNILYSTSGDPFIEGWKENIIYYVEYKGNFYRVEKFEEEQPVSLSPNRRSTSSSTSIVEDTFTSQVVIKYRIISDIDLTGKESELNTKIVVINSDNVITNYDITNYDIPEFDSADIWIIEINGLFHNLIKDGSSIKVNTDYAFTFKENSYEYWINENDPSYKTTVDLIVTANNPPKNFKIYRLKLTDIKDFDTSIVDTEYSKFEYEEKESLTITDESKLYTTDLRSNSDPKTINDYIYKDSVVHIPTSSEYTANSETFRISNNDLSEIWRKNSTYCRWSYQNSLSSCDYPYLMNNSNIFEDFNRSVNIFDPDPKRTERNLDYFYTINAGTTSYIHHTLHIENNINGYLDDSFKFELDKYLNMGTYSIGTSSATYSFDYFSYFFDRKTTFDNGNITKNVKKFSNFNKGDNIIPNTTIFKGLKFNIYDVENIKLNDGEIENINLKNSNMFEDYKFSILLSDNDWSVTDTGGITSSVNQMQWTIIEDWVMDKNYPSGTIVSMNDILYQSTIDTITTVPARVILGVDVKSAPYNDTDWVVYNYTYGVGLSPFWNPSYSYIGGEIAYNDGEYYINNGSGTTSFWNPLSTYTLNDIVLYKNKYYISLTGSNNQPPDNGILWRSGNEWKKYWESTSTPTSTQWDIVEIWNPINTYPGLSYVVNNNILYNGSGLPGEEPGVAGAWTRVYSIEPDTNFIYATGSNPFIRMNNKYYMITSNSSNSTLENGINIYINKKWKNILVNISITDNTTPNLSNINRDLMYNDLNKKLTANNLISCINDISTKYGFSDYLNYTIIEKDGSINKYNKNNISSLPHMMICEDPEEVLIRSHSLKYDPISLGKNIIKPLNFLKNGNIKDISQLNYYNEIPVGSQISYNRDEPKVLPKYHGERNITNNSIYRYSGYYMPLFYDIELFQCQGLTSNGGNYKFDTSLVNFGIMRQRVISKINRKDNILKLKNNSSYKSIYPMLDEFGYTAVNFFIFKSTWDYEYHVECGIPKVDSIKTLQNISSSAINIAEQTVQQNLSL